ncbi:tRNA(Ile)-lysidine synthase (tRNA(Ile)-lysidinesynthetase) (tRNA(Ile)-2-lysyl-cytidine synthase) [Candidatus Riesia pediculicola USDA]|uniref:tRNA(Ile)-lysidine synthase n=1 Tax=Riesia pediculicola (strain USDA) TaxID=515618 RepID=D4G8D6_RIEPU|nr:tRNA lysidine(34) synthetase TilS [Candidatus Riesia pediculicola]ADD79941.1 tRNA(Ile)-lysidine synthase (tRNA(Ile)-lysidinesynthetase) (tRNA(Ile)-2-lysyl-cytidine synthase) [Candidatus Riesia pediculicola USDA]
MKKKKDEPYNLLKLISKSLNPFKKVLVGFSGGMDSTVLLHILMTLRKLKKIKIDLRAIHINHHLQKESNLWESHCKKICDLWKISFLSKRVKISSKKYGVESESRAIRYREMRNVLRPKEVIMTAHHIDDQAETFLLALKRGSGPSGLSSMKFITSFHDKNIVRPLLSFEKTQLKKYAEENRLSWIEDQSNFQDLFDRNFLRIHVLSILNRRWPYFSKAISNSAKLCEDQENLIEELIKPHFLRLFNQRDSSLKIKELLTFSKIKRNVILRNWFKVNHLPNPSRIQLKVLWNNVIRANPNSQPELVVFKKYVIRKFRSRLFCFQKFKEINESRIVWKNLSNDILLPGNLGKLVVCRNKRNICSRTINKIRKPKTHEIVSIRFDVRSKEKVRLGTEIKSTTIKKIWRQCNIAPWMRRRIPAIFYNSKLIAIIDLFVTEEGSSISSNQICIKWIKK